MGNTNWCVYKHTCPNGKVYIGLSKDVKKRWGQYGEQYKECKKFHNAIMKYGWINIKHEILKSNLAKEDAGIFENEMIQKYKSTNPKYGYNMTSGGFGCPNHSGYRRVEVYDLNGNYINKFNTIKEASDFTGVGAACISHICNKNKGHVSGKNMIFIFEGDTLELDRIGTKNCIHIYKLDENKNIIKEYISLKKAAQDVKCDPSSISKAITRGSSILGYFWCKKEMYDTYKINVDRTTYPKPVSQYTLDGKFVKQYPSIAQASIETKTNKNGIISCLKNRYKKSGGYVWKYAS